jgi:N6-L-threonylcarbamoyladenine synthase
MLNILGIESSCDETSAAVVREGTSLSNIISSQLQHQAYGGVIPELASRLHQQHIVKVVDEALEQAGVAKKDLNAIAVTEGPGLIGALLVGHGFAKAMAFALGIPLIAVDHLEAHVLANFLKPDPPRFPFICLTVSGGHTQLVLVRDFLDMEIVGTTRDDAAGEAFDKAAKILGLPYPGGPLIDKLAQKGNTGRFAFPISQVPDLDFSFSGLKTALLYLLKKEQAADPGFIEAHIQDLAADYQKTVVDTLLAKVSVAVARYGVKDVALAGGVSANSELRTRFQALGEQQGWKAHLPDFQYCTDNAAMIAAAGYYKFQAGLFAQLDSTPYARAGQGG